MEIHAEKNDIQEINDELGQQEIKRKYDVDELGIPRNNKVYREKEYWDFRFQTEEQYDWISDIETMEKKQPGFLGELYDKLKDKKILNIGNGTSLLPQQLCNLGIKSENLTSCDYIENVVEKMQNKFGNSCGQWLVADITKLQETIAPKTYNVVLEKCTLDALTVSPKDPWNPDQELKDRVKSVFQGAHMVLASPGDIFISLSFEQPHFRKKYFDEEIQQLFTNLEVARKIEIGFNECYIYYFQKK